MKTPRVMKTLRWLGDHSRYTLPADEVEARLTRWALAAPQEDFDKALAYAGRLGGKVSSLFCCSLAPLRLRKQGKIP